MAAHNDLGRRGEEMAAQLLREKGYHIVERNWRDANLEVDIIARTKTDIVFVEVKTRSDDTLMRPEEAVDWQKQRNLTLAAQHYIQKKRISLNIRFDVVSIVLNERRCDIQHIEDAFYPTAPRLRRY